MLNIMLNKSVPQIMAAASTMWIILLIVTVVSAYQEHFQEPTWLGVFSAGGMHIGRGRTKRFAQINEDKPNVAFQECVLPNGEKGHCRYLHYCAQEEYKNNFKKFVDYLCIIQNADLGICCPDDKSQGQAESLAGHLPATAEENEASESLLKIGSGQTYRGCGLSTRSHGRATGAQPANPREWPWMASITPEGFEQYCGGVLITDRHVLTAAHCTRRWKTEELYVRLGEYDMQRQNDSRTYNFRVVEKRQHEEFDHTTFHHDIAILKLDRPAVFNSYVWPICLPPPGLQLDAQSAIIIGWGTQWYGGPNSDVLMEVQVPIWQREKCLEAFADSFFEENLCAGGLAGGKDACQGDSGGPLMYEMPSGRWATIGIVSWGIRCGEPTHPGIYARVDKYLQWIVNNALY